MQLRILGLSLVALLTVAGCRASSSPEPTPRRVGPAPAPSPSVSQPPVNPPGIVVRNVAFGKSKPRIHRAIGDLKDVRLWYRLTKHLYQVKFGSRLGVTNIPEDGHLADAVLTAAIEEDGQGALCDIMFFPNAITQDLKRWATYSSQGLTRRPPPSARDYWAAILAHELAHCLDHGSGEKVAEGWEKRALRELEAES